MYRAKRLKPPAEYGDDLKQLFSGMKRIEADNDQTTNPKNSGKQALTYSLYKTQCKATLEVNDGGFSHLFLTSQWNLMCRSMSVQTIQTQHLLERDDSVGVIFVKTKTNQDGSGPRDPRHVYSNSLSPATCWVTALGIYLACHPRLQPGALFPGSNQKLRFGKVLTQLLKLEESAKSYGTHSVRKGVATFACGGSTGGPSIVSVCLRYGWTIGGVQDRYFRYEAAGNQFLGRVVAGLPVNDSRFALLPPHFCSVNSIVTSNVQIMFPGLAEDLNLSGVLRLSLASLVYHAEYLRQHLPLNHPLLSTHIFANPGVLDELKGMLEIKESSSMQPSGIPPYIQLYKKLDRRQQSIDDLPRKLEERMEHVLEKKGVAAGNITRDLLREEIRALLDEVGLRRGAEITDTTPLPNPVRHYHTWGGKFHVLPKDFNFPSIDPLGAWLLWWFGNTKLHYPPYRNIPTEDLDSQKKKATLSEWSVMMRYIINGIEEKLSAPMPAITDEKHAIKLFNKGYATLKLKPSKRKRRDGQLKLTTVLRLIRENNRAQDSPRSRPFRPRKRQKAASTSDAEGTTLSVHTEPNVSDIAAREVNEDQSNTVTPVLHSIESLYPRRTTAAEYM